MLKIFIADDHPLFRDAIISVIRERFPQTHIAEADDLPSALASLLHTEAETNIAVAENDGWDLLLLDLNMPGMDGLNGLIQVRNALPDMTVIVVSAEVERQTILQAMNFGAAGYIPKSSSRTQMADAIEKVLAGDVYVPAEILRQATPPIAAANTGSIAATSQINPSTLHALTRKQLQVLERMTRGESNKQIAHHLNIAETTVKTHVSAILRLLGAQNRVQAILAAKQLDFTPYLRH
ncbi:response regulator transcription factor [Salinispirillum sp. LH 10-3-1]|uniref:Response regulator transcription factor n=1 Tax=Salinispirillum sp. LH 10-3-1 TaxID=2952525 RepID=A0AB38YKK3_9GAMM